MFRSLLAYFLLLLFAVSCGGSDSGIMEMVEEVAEEMEETPEPDSTEPEASPGPETSPDFVPIEIPSSFMGEGDTDSELDDAHLVPEEMIEMVIDALTTESARTAFVRRIREASFCNALDDVSDEEIWNEVVDQFNLDSRLHTSGNSLEEAVRNLLAYDLNLDYSGEDESDFYGDTVEGEEFWSILADEVDGLDNEPGECS